MPESPGEYLRLGGWLSAILLAVWVLMILVWLLLSASWLKYMSAVPVLAAVAILSTMTVWQRRIYKKVIEHDGAICFACGYPGPSDIGDRCTECGRVRTLNDMQLIDRQFSRPLLGFNRKR